MAEPPAPPPPPPQGAAQSAREARRAAALRQNLRRRKAQARAREAPQDELPSDAAAKAGSVAAPDRPG